MPDFDLIGELSLKIELHMLRPITEKVHSGNGPVSLVKCTVDYACIVYLCASDARGEFHSRLRESIEILAKISERILDSPPFNLYTVLYFLLQD